MTCVSSFVRACMLLSALIPVVVANTIGQEGLLCEFVDVVTVELEPDERNNFAKDDVTLDLYIPSSSCPGNKGGELPSPNLRSTTRSLFKYPTPPSRQPKNKKIAPPSLVVMAGGGGLDTADYSMFAKFVAKRGFVVAMINHPVQQGPSTSNLATPVDVSNAINYVKSQDDFQVDLTETVLFGHSQGGGTMLFSTAEICPVPFCTNVQVPLPSEVKFAATYGTTTYAKMGAGPKVFFPTFTNFVSSRDEALPFLLLLGEGDESNIDLDPENDNTLLKNSFDHLHPNKCFAVPRNLDHYSICNRIPENHGRDDVVSKLPREEQVKTVAKTFLRWIRFNSAKKHVRYYSFCEAVLDGGTIPLSRCGEEIEL